MDLTNQSFTTGMKAFKTKGSMQAAGNTPIASDDKILANGISTNADDYNVNGHRVIFGNCLHKVPGGYRMWTDCDSNGVVDDVFGANFVDAGNPTGNPMDDHSHGSHVAGTVAAVSDNKTGVSGVAWKTQIMAVKFLSAGGSGTTAGAIAAIDYAVENGAHILNNSWGGGGFSTFLKEAIEIANKKGVLFVAAAGNESQDNDKTPHYPSNYDVPNVLSVMATDKDDKPAWFTNYGQNSVDVAAPGVDILAPEPGNSYGYKNGTSMATPIVTGIAALIKAQKPSFISAQLKDRIMKTVDQIGHLKDLSVTGGRVNLIKAVEKLSN